MVDERHGSDPYEPPKASLDVETRAAPTGAALPWTAMDAVTFGWETLKRRPGAAAAMFVATLVASIPNLVSVGLDVWATRDPDPLLETLSMAALIASYVIGWPLSVWIQLGAAKYALALARGSQPETRVLYSGGALVSALFAMVLMMIALVAGFALCIVPGVILLLGWLPYVYVVAERRTGPIETLVQTWRLTSGHKGQMGIYVLLMIGLGMAALVGLLAACVGVLVTWAAVLLILQVAQAWIYLKLSGEEPRLVRVS